MQCTAQEVDIMVWWSPHLVTSGGAFPALQPDQVGSDNFKAAAFDAMRKSCSNGLVAMPFPGNYNVSFQHDTTLDGDRVHIVCKAKYYKHKSQGSGSARRLCDAKQERIAMLVPEDDMDLLFQFFCNGVLMVGPFLLSYYRRCGRRCGSRVPRCIELGCNTASLSCELIWACINGY